jgi:hypothetical protein
MHRVKHYNPRRAIGATYDVLVVLLGVVRDEEEDDIEDGVGEAMAEKVGGDLIDKSVADLKDGILDRPGEHLELPEDLGLVRLYAGETEERDGSLTAEARRKGWRTRDLADLAAGVEEGPENVEHGREDRLRVGRRAVGETAIREKLDAREAGLTVVAECGIGSPVFVLVDLRAFVTPLRGFGAVRTSMSSLCSSRRTRCMTKVVTA